ncbi:MAG TPA: DUF2058 family protein [Lysobacter sp.]|nr:DUF2058 family protein [Lysobacter sp.]
MSNSLRDQLLGLGFSAPKPEPRPRRDAQKPAAKGAKPAHAGKPKPRQHRPQRREDIDLAKAYAIRMQKEKDERIEAERLKQEEARKRREAKARLAELLQGKALNAGIDEADHVRHFEYGGKIKRVHVTAAQLAALNAGEIGVVQVDGRYLLVDAATLVQAEAVFAPAVALKVDPDAPVADDPYSDPKYQVPDDLAW